MANKEKIDSIAARLAALSPEAQEEELKKIERNVTKRESKAQKDAIGEHKIALASAFVDTLTVYCRDKKVEASTFLPLNVKIAASEDGKGIEGVVSGRGGKSGGGGGTRGESFLKSNGVVAIERNGQPLAKCAESEVLRVAHNAKTAKDVYGSASPHLVAMKPENQKLIRDMNFIAVDADGNKRPLIDVYASAN